MRSPRRPPERTQRRLNKTAAENVVASGISITATCEYASHPADVASIPVLYKAARSPNSRRTWWKKSRMNAALSIATGSLGAKSSPRPALKPSAVIQYSSGGFSNHASPHNRGVIQSPETAISLPMEA